MKYEDMSDFEINEQVARLRFDVFAACHDGSRKNGSVRESGVEFDPCNNPSDAWPIIIENKIAVWPESHGEWQAMRSLKGKVNIRSINKNPLSAAMICFLKMKDADK